MCLKHSEAKQSKTLELGAEKGLLQVQARRTSGSGSKDLNSKDTTEFQRRVFKDKGRKKSCIVYDQLGCTSLVNGEVTEWCHRG